MWFWNDGCWEASCRKKLRDDNNETYKEKDGLSILIVTSSEVWGVVVVGHSLRAADMDSTDSKLRVFFRCVKLIMLFTVECACLVHVVCLLGRPHPRGEKIIYIFSFAGFFSAPVATKKQCKKMPLKMEVQYRNPIQKKRSQKILNSIIP